MAVLRRWLMHTVPFWAALALFAGNVVAGEIRWERSFDSARARSVKEGKLLFIDFDADW
jgi:hypothetical protein